ncbi:MAG: short-chain fatty acid transporter [Candidatus Eremiobacteraeota bacterium]|nr:short-chain fatty acid transporter [Candidatus Eremiobacteraeota bacterium]
MARVGQVFDRFARRFMPDPFVFAILLTLVTLVAGLVATDHGLVELIGFWGDGFWEFLAFSMQMCVILVTGHALTQARPVRRLLAALVGLPRTSSQAIALVAVCACMAAWVNWGFGLIVGALLARDVGRDCRRRGLVVHYPLLGAAGYTGLGIWHGGLSGSAPLTVAEAKHSMVDILGVVPISQTILAPRNLVVTLILLVVIPLTLVNLQPEQPEECPPAPPEPEAAPEVEKTPAERLEHSPVLAFAVVLLGSVWLFSRPFNPGLNTVNLAFLVLGLALHASPKAYSEAIADGAGGVAGIVLQFPFYAGIMGIMKSSGLIMLIASGFVVASQSVYQATGVQVFYLLTFLSAGLVNMFVPSGGGQWIVQGPIVVEAASRLGLGQPEAIMAIAYGDQWTNLLQPFWALPLLAITGLEARQLIGYTIPVLFTTGLVFGVALLL